MTNGLSSEQAKKLLDDGYGNLIADHDAKSTKQIVRENTVTFFNFVFVVLALLLVIAGRFNDMAFLVIAAINSVIGIVQQIRSRNELSKLKVLSESRITAIRDGRPTEIPIHEIVKGDLIELSSGNQIPADGMVVSGKIQVNESLLTGEADLITKGIGDTILSGSFVVSGTCRAHMEQVGNDSYAAQLTNQAKATGKQLYFSDRAQSVGCELGQVFRDSIDPERPYEAMARRLVYHSMNGSGLRRIENGILCAKEAGADGVIWFNHWGCKHTLGNARLAKKKFEEAGLPLLILDNDGCDRSHGGEGQMATRLEAFLEMLEAGQSES